LRIITVRDQFARRIASNSDSSGYIASHYGASLYNRASADVNALENRRIVSDPHVIRDNDRLHIDGWSSPPVAHGRQSDCIAQAGGRRNRMKVGVDDRHAASQVDSASNDNSRRTSQIRISDVALIRDFDKSSRAHRK
jgi:hypothetical protein